MDSTKQLDNKQILGIFIGVSLVFHLFASFIYLKDHNQNWLSNLDKPEEKVIKIKLQNFNKNKPQQIAQTETSTKKKADKAKFLSDKNNAFERETRSANNGKFQVAGKGVRTAMARKNAQVAKKSRIEKLKKLKFSDLSIKATEQIKIKKKRKVAKTAQTRKGLKNGQKTGRGLGSTNDFLEDIPLGDFTRLNSQEYEFYGFYHRIRQKLEQFWGLNIQEKAESISKQGRSIASDSNLITGLTINLNQNGEIVSINLKSTSGVKELDDAAVESFNQAGPFPNPPKGMLKNGKATIEWGFVVNT